MSIEYSIAISILLLLTFIISLKYKKFEKLVIFIGMLSSIIYVCWRFTTIPEITVGKTSFILGTILFIAEVFGLFQFGVFNFLCTRKYNLKEKILYNTKDDSLPTVNILICTYNEPVRLIEKTLTATLNLDYNHSKLNVYVCDDGKRDSIKKLCDKYNANHLVRTSNLGAKAGNINNALGIVQGDLICVLDADMVPKRNFLKKTVCYFNDYNVGFVQVPQSYYNQDVYQYNLNKKMFNEQDFFMRDIQSHRSAINATVHVGTNAIFSKRALDDIGGLPTFSITEDMALGLILQASGYKTIFVNEPLVLGLSATNFSDLIKQRDRWCRGNLQVAKHVNPLFKKGLNISQRIAYLDGIFYWLSGIQNMIFILSPLCYLIFGVFMITTSVRDLLAFYIPYFLSQIILFNMFSPKTRTLIWSHYYNTIMAPYLCISVIKEFLFIKSLKFNVTAKDHTYTKRYFQFSSVFPHIVLLSITILGWALGAKHMLYSTKPITVCAFNILWSFYNFLPMFMALRVAYQRPIFRETERVIPKFNMKVKIITDDKIVDCHVRDFSDKGMGLSTPNNLVLLNNQKITIDIFGHKIAAQVVRSTEKVIGVEFLSLDKESMLYLIKLYVDSLVPYFDLDELKDESIESIPEDKTSKNKILVFDNICMVNDYLDSLKYKGISLDIYTNYKFETINISGKIITTSTDIVLLELLNIPDDLSHIILSTYKEFSSRAII